MVLAERRIRKIVPLVCWLGTLATIGSCAKLPEIHVIGDRGFSPYESCEAGDDSRAAGITVEQWRLMGRKAGFRIKYTCDKWESALKAVLGGKADAVGGLARSDSREKHYRFVRQLARNPTHFYYRKEKDQDLSLRDIVIERRAVGVVAGDYAVELLLKDFPDILLNYYDTYDAVVEGAKKNEINVFVMEEAVAADLLTKNKISQVFTRSPNAVFKSGLWAAVKKENSELAKKLDDGFRKVTDDELAEIERRGAPSPGILATAIRRGEEWVADNPGTSGLGVFLLTYAFAICALFIIAPLQLFYVSVWLRRMKLQLPSVVLDLAPLRIISLIWLVDTSQRVLNAWLVNRRPVILQNFARRKTVGDRKSHYLMPFVIDGLTIEVPSVQERCHELVTRLRSVFARPGSCVSIIGEGGSGKTSLACWVARNALQAADDPADRIFLKLTVPIMLEGPLAQPIVDAIHAQLINLVEEEVPQEILTALMRKGHVLVIVDGFSEFDKTSREKVETIGPTVPRFSMIVTGRRDVPVFGGVAKTEIKPLPVSRTVLASFLEFLLRESGAHQKLSNAEFFDGCKNLSKLTGDRAISPLLVVLYAALLAPMNNGGASSAATVNSIPDIFLEFVNRLNSALKDDPIGDVTVHRHLRTVAWSCMSTDFRPQPSLRADLLPLIDGGEATLKYLENRLGLIETIKPTQTHVRFLLDPLAEYLAAAFLCTEGSATGNLGVFLSHVADREENAPACLGLCQAVVDTAFARTAISTLIAPEDLQALTALAAWLGQQAMVQDAAPVRDPFDPGAGANSNEGPPPKQRAAG